VAEAAVDVAEVAGRRVVHRGPVVEAQAYALADGRSHITTPIITMALRDQELIAFPKTRNALQMSRNEGTQRLH